MQTNEKLFSLLSPIFLILTLPHSPNLSLYPRSHIPPPSTDFPTIRVASLTMYRRPNAPFKPPRPLGANSQTRNSPKKPSDSTAELFVAEEQSHSPQAESSFQPSPPLKPVTNSKGVSSAGQPAKRIRLTAPKLTRVESSSQSSGETPSQTRNKFYLVQWRKRSNKKNKSWEGDGYIVVSLSSIVLKIEQKNSYKVVGRTSTVNTDGVIRLGLYEAEIDSEISRNDVHELCGGGGNSQTGEPKSLAVAEVPKPKTELRAPGRPQSSKIANAKRASTNPPEDVGNVTSTVPDQASNEGELVLPSGDIANAKRVAVDPCLTKVLRPHQREGVRFLYECVMGFKSEKHTGALLADEMGLGKTLMTIALLWTLLKQSPHPGQSSVIKKALICCPVSLIENWRKEFKKWIDVNRIGILTVNNKQQSPAKDKQDIVNFGKVNVYQVLIMSYEKVLSCSEEFASVKFDFLVCDEGHRLKSGSNKVLKVLNTLNIPKKLVLTGTPIQNDLNEFYNIINFINPGILGLLQEFQKSYLKPILRARDVNCMNKEVIKEGKQKSSLLIELTKSFTLRRTKSVINKYLPTKTDIIVFCPPSSLQRQLFDVVLKSTKVNSIMTSDTSDALSMILLLRKICNSPSLIASDQLFESLKTESDEFSSLSNRTSGSKVNVLVPLLLEFQKLGEKAVLVSNYTQTLDFLELILLKLNIDYSRLDGSTPSKIRDRLVVDFNKSPAKKVFILSAKAGGVGLNLVGASRLVLYDNDWNPLVDLQAMARIHRDGQTKPVFIYRLFTTGAIDEKIFQRQLMKNNLSDMFIDDKTDSTLNVFDYADLKDLFTIADTNCNTHDLLDCQCDGVGELVSLQEIPLDTDEDDTMEDIQLPSSGFMSASEFKDLDGTDDAKKQSIRSALSSYLHFDPEVFKEHMDTGDLILNALALNPKTKKLISYILTHSTGSPA